MKIGAVLSDEIRRLYVDELLDARQIAAICGVHSSTVYRRLEETGVKRRSIGAAARLRMVGALPPDDSDVVRLYERGLSCTQITHILHMGKGTVWETLQCCGVEMRANGESTKRRAGHRRRPKPSLLCGIPQCAVCGAAEGLEWHHLNGLRDDDRPENLMALCWEHHQLIEYLVIKALAGVRDREAVA